MISLRKDQARNDNVCNVVTSDRLLLSIVLLNTKIALPMWRYRSQANSQQTFVGGVNSQKVEYTFWVLFSLFAASYPIDVCVDRRNTRIFLHYTKAIFQPDDTLIKKPKNNLKTKKNINKNPIETIMANYVMHNASDNKLWPH